MANNTLWYFWDRYNSKYTPLGEIIFSKFKASLDGWLKFT